jgi:hypothetical protein
MMPRMTADGWAPIDAAREETGSSGDPPAPDRPAGPEGPEGEPRRRGRRWLVVGVGVLVVIAAAAAAFVVAGGDGPGGSATGDGDGEVASEPAADVPPSEAWSVATRRLSDAGTFAYSGTVRSDGPSTPRPGIWRSGELSVEGEVVLPDRAHEIAIDGTGYAVETVSEHVVVWGREAPREDELAAQSFGVVAELDHGVSSLPSGAALIERWLSVAVDRAAGGTDSQGRQRFTGALHTLVGEYDPAEPAPDPVAEIVLVVDEAGDPARIELTSLPGQPALELTLDISRIGERLSVPLPAGHPRSVRGTVTVDQVRAAGIPAPVELGALPADWVLFRVELRADVPGPGCSTLRLWYADVPVLENTDNLLVLDVRSAACPFTLGLTGAPITLGPFTGTVAEERGGLTVEASDATTTIEVVTDITVDDLVALGASLRPFDPAVAPGVLDAPSP